MTGPPMRSAIERTSGKLAPAWLRKTGDASYSLYLIHVPAFLVVGKLVSLVVPDTRLDNILLIALFTASAIAAGFALHHFVERPLLGFTRRIGDRLFAAKSQTSVAPEKAW
ncbi:MAG: hypothetical protein AAB227_00490 [Pseudomonadota bacterium]